VEGEYEALEGRTFIDGPLGRLTLRGGGNLGVMSLDGRLGEQGFETGASLVLLAPEGQQKIYTAHRGFTLGRGFLHLGAGATLEFKQPDESIGLGDASSALAETVEIDGGAIRSASGEFTGKTLRPIVLTWRDGVIGSTQEPLRIELPVLHILPGKVSKRLAGHISVLVSLAVLKGATQSDDFFMDGGSVTVGNAWTFENSSAIRKLLGGGQFVVGGTGLVHVNNSNDLRENPPSINVRIDVPFESTGQVQVDGPPESSLRITDGVKQLVGNTLTAGEWIVRKANLLEISGDIVEIVGEKCVVELEGTAEFRTFRLKENAGHLTFFDHEHSAPHEVNNAGTLLLLGDSKLAVNGFMKNSGKLEVDAGAEIMVGGDFVHEPEGKLKINGKITALGRITLEGPIRGSGSFIPGIDASPLSFMDIADAVEVGASPGVLSVTGSMQFRNTATLVIELAGTRTEQFDLLSVTGAASLNGTLAINLIDGFLPAGGDSFTITKAGSVTGQFANAANGQRLATIDGLGSFVVNYTPSAVVLTAFEANPNPPSTSQGRLLPPTFGFRIAELTLTGSPGRDYILETSTNLLNWLSLQTNNASFNGQLLFEIPAATDPHRFFRTLSR
jgi:hypothetical protein